MIQVSEKQVSSVLTANKTLEAIREAYKDNANGQIYMPDRMYMDIRGKKNMGQWLIANDLKKPYFGAKFSAVFPNNRSKNLPVTNSQISLYSANDGQLLALIDANYLTAIKTGGSAAVATDLLANKDANTLAVIGSGFQAYAQVKMIQHVRHLNKVIVFDLSKDHYKKFKKQIEDAQEYPYDIVYSSSADEAIASADIICTCTPSHTPVFHGQKLKDGAHINAIGSFTPEMQEIDTTTVQRASKVFTEHVDGLWKAAGDILIPYQNHDINKAKVNGSIGDILVGQKTARLNDDEITLYESVGSGVLDIALGILVYESLTHK